MIFKEIKEKLEELELIGEEFAFMRKESDIDGVGHQKTVDSYGGEDCGIEWYVVRYFREHDVYIRLDGYYYSYDGVHFEDHDLVEVFPTEVIKIEYLPKK